MRKLKEVAKDLREGRPPDGASERLRNEMWQRINQARRHKRISLTNMPAWIWTVGSIGIILLAMVLMFMMRH